MTQALMTSLGGRDVLSRFTLFNTRDLDEARNRVAGVFCPHDLKFAGGDSRVNTRMQHAPIRGVSINRLGYGATVAIDAGCLNDFLLVMMPLSGHADVRCGGLTIHSTPDLASVVTPTLPLWETIYDECDQIMVKIDRTLLENICAQHLGHPLRKPLEFSLGLTMSSQGGVSWQALVSYLVSELEHQSPMLASSLVAAQIEHLLVTTLLMIQPNNYRDELVSPPQSIAPRHVRRVEEYIDAHADRELTVGDLAAHANVSTSALFAGFRRVPQHDPDGLPEIGADAARA